MTWLLYPLDHLG